MMRDMSMRARSYLGLCLVLGLVSFGWLIRDLPNQLTISRDWWLALVLVALASIAQIFVVLRAGNLFSDHLTPALFFAALLLLPSPLIALLVCLSFLPEWIWYRRVWPDQLFSISAWLVALAAGKAVLFGLSGHD